MSTASENELFKAEMAGANSAAVQLVYRLPQIERNPHAPESELHAAYHHGYQMERAMRGAA
jgi:hypothetical protein